MKGIAIVLFALTALLLPQSLFSAASVIVWDQTPDAVGGTVTSCIWSNDDSQNFTDPVTFSGDTMITGMDIYMSELFVFLSQQGIFHMRTGSHPGRINRTGAGSSAC